MYVIVGHSERRQIYGESDASVAAKFAQARENGLVPILCVGETLDERESRQTEAVIARQLDAVLVSSGVEGFGNAVIAYEPVWAIGTGKTATPEQAQQVHTFILYGGSMKSENAGALLQENDIDGGLIGGASLNAEDFVAIVASGT